MDFVDSKKQAINNVALLGVIGDLPKGKSTSSLNSVTSKSRNILPYLIDLLTTTCKDNKKTKKNKKPDEQRNLEKPSSISPSTSAEPPVEKNNCNSTRILTDILIVFYPTLMRILKEGLIKGIKAGLACGVDFTIPGPTAPNFKIKLSNVDFDNLLKINPTSENGKIFYGKDSDTDFNWFLYNLVQTGGSNTWKNILDLTYFTTTEELEVKVNGSYVGKKFDVFLSDAVNSMDLISLQTLLSRLMDSLMGSMTAALDNPPSLDKLISKEKINKLQDNINDSDPCTEDYSFDDSFFKFTNDELYEIENTAQQKYYGSVNMDVGCGILPITLESTILPNMVTAVINTPPSKINSVIEGSISTINDSLTSNIADSDKNLVKTTLNTKMITDLSKVTTNVILEPKMVILYQISLKTVNDTIINVSEGFDYTKACSVFFKFVCRESLAALIEIIFNKLKMELIHLVSDVAAKIVKDQNRLKLKSISNIVTGVVGGTILTLPTPNTSEFI